MDSRFSIHRGDCLDALREMPSNAQSHRTSRASGEGPVD